LTRTPRIALAITLLAGALALTAPAAHAGAPAGGAGIVDTCVIDGIKPPR
jgi:hypothetical protein